MSKIPSVPALVTTTTPEIQSSSAVSLRDDLAAASLEEQRPDEERSESIGGGSAVSVTDEPGECRELDGLGNASEEQLSVRDDSRPSSSASTPRSPARGKLIPSPLDIASGSESLSRNMSPLAREGVRVSHSKDEGASPGIYGSHTPPAISKTTSVDNPKSPFFIPTNPFLIQVDRMPKFQWSTLHFNLLEAVLKSLHEIINKWRR